jgi:DNA-binding transcriptional LysR family regulator
MEVTLDQARALDALARHGTFAKAAAALRKQHTGVLYALRALEESTGLTLLDRTGYRTKLTPAGELVLAQCRRLLDAERDLATLCEVMRTGWEPRLGIVFDGVVPAEGLLRVVGELAREGVPTRLTVTAEFLGGVEEAFVRAEADVMISVLPPQTVSLRARAMPPVRSLLVAHRKHPLVARGAAVTDEELRAQVLLVVRGSDPRLRLSTAALEVTTVVSLNDFHAKKTSLLDGLGYGWMPEHLIAKELRRGTLARVRWKAGSTHTFHPHVYTHGERAPGRAAQRVIDALVAPRRVAAPERPHGGDALTSTPARLPVPRADPLGGGDMPSARARRVRHPP